MHHDEQQFWVWPAGSIDDPLLTGGEATMQGNTGLRKEALPRTTVITEQGYILEFELPRALISNCDLTPGRIIGFNTCLGTNGPTCWNWSAGANVHTFQQPDTWGDLLLAGADAKLSLADRPDFKTKAVLTPGQSLKLRVVDGDMNLSPNRRDKVMVTIKPAHGGEQIVVLEETSENSGVFDGSVSTALALDVNPTGTLAVYEGESVVVCYVDQARANGARNVEVKLPLTFGSAIVQLVQSQK